MLLKHLMFGWDLLVPMFGLVNVACSIDKE